MDGIHDMGGRQGFGRVRYTLNAQPFHHDWEVRVNSLYAFAVRSGIFNMDEYRHAIERMEPRHYLSASYYERSMTGLATLCVEKGVMTREELERAAGGTFPLSRPSAPGRTNAPAPAAGKTESSSTQCPDRRRPGERSGGTEVAPCGLK